LQNSLQRPNVAHEGFRRGIMKFVSFVRSNQTPVPGVWLDDSRILDLRAAIAEIDDSIDSSSLLSLIRGGAAALRALRQAADSGERHVVPAGEVRLVAPIPQLLRNAFCVGRNYHEHVAEGHRARGTEAKLPAVPQFFTKATHAVNGPDGAMRLDPQVTQQLDYEVELALIIGHGGRDIQTADAFEHIFGYTIANDITARDLQRSHEQWFKGKSLDGSLPLGPWIVDKEEIGDPRSLALSLEVNGEMRQSATVGMMIFDIPAIVASLSKGMTLEAGDIVCTGTPSGVGYAMQPPRFLKAKDRVTCRIDRIGTLTNIVAGP
jgi:2-keto-4-pentenoate hydratase/2-oxohepta-3-ene-1,7-dioic acid hydratase in catechol pathway